jgi:uncharacterized protein (UPF0335 family)
MMSLGRNTVSGEALESFVVRVEGVRAAKKQLSADEAQIMAEAKAAGFLPNVIRMVVQRRALKPHVWQEIEALLEMYLHALGHSVETPLFRQVARIDVDIVSRESVIEALKGFVPQNGAITVEAGGRPVKLTRDKDGTVTAKEVADPPPSPAAGKGAPSAAPSGMKAAAPPPDVDAEGAEMLGREAFRANAPIITNPFPFGDARRPRWDEGWRLESGSDGMGGERKP